MPWKTLPAVALVVLAGCILRTETVSGPQGDAGAPGQQGEPGVAGPAGSSGPPGVSPFSYTDPSMVDIYYSGGNVGIGTSMPQAALDVSGSIHVATGSLIYTDRRTFIPDSLSYSYKYTLPSAGLFKVSIGVQSAGGQCGSPAVGTWSISMRSYEALRLGGYPETVKLTPLTQTFESDIDNSCSTRITATGLVDGIVQFDVINANGATVTMSTLSLW